MVDLGLAGTTFVWVHRRDAGEVLTWESRVRGRRLEVRDPLGPARAEARHGLVSISATGGLQLAIENLAGQPLHVDLSASPGTPVVCATPTPAGGWNATEKSAGYSVTGSVTLGDEMLAFDGRGWRDWTAGRQDRHTTWLWAAGAGHSTNGRPVGLNASTGMNGVGLGENVVWVDGRPMPIDVRLLGPVTPGEPSGEWRLEGTDLDLRFRPLGVRAANENLLVVRSSYVQPIGTFHGTLPSPDGGTVEVDGMPGVTEDHEAHW